CALVGDAATDGRSKVAGNGAATDDRASEIGDAAPCIFRDRAVDQDEAAGIRDGSLAGRDRLAIECGAGDGGGTAVPDRIAAAVLKRPVPSEKGVRDVEARTGRVEDRAAERSVDRCDVIAE